MGRLGDFIDEWWPEGLLGSPAIAGVAASLYPTQHFTIFGMEVRYGLLFLVASVILAIVGGAGVTRKKQRFAEIERAELASRQIAEKYHEDIRELIQDNLRDLSIDCELNNGPRKCRPDTRISVYCHDKENHRFIPIARISGDPEFEKSGRSSYPDDEGIICKAWRNEICTYEFGLTRESAIEFARDFETTPEEAEEIIWLDDQVNEFKVPKSVAMGFSMKSKSAVAWRIEHRDKKIGVVVIESTNKDVANGALQELVGRSSHFPPLQRALYRINESHIRHVASLADQV